jgi:hypothetical protein
MYAKKAKWSLCITLGFEPRTSSIACCILYHYATSVNFLVARYIKFGLYTLSKTFTTHGRPGNRSLGLNGSGTRPRLGPPGRPWRAGPVQVSASGLLRVTVGQASQAGSPLTWPVINCWASSKHGPPETPGQVGPWSETQVWNFPTSKVLVRRRFVVCKPIASCLNLKILWVPCVFVNQYV